MSLYEHSVLSFHTEVLWWLFYGWISVFVARIKISTS